MISRYLGNYKTFQCIADKCPSTCCSGWAVEIDDESLKKYKEINLEGVDYEDGTFYIMENKDCYFLNEKHLCNLYLKHGEGIFCRTCDMYPRHIEEFPNVREHSLSLSCPVVAREFLDLEKDVLSVSEISDDNKDNEDYEDFDDDLYASLYKCRGDLLDIIRNGVAPFTHKCEMILKSISDFQDEYDGNVSDYNPVISLSDNSYALYLLDLFLELEPLNESFISTVKRIKEAIEDNEAKGNKSYVAASINSFFNNHNDFIKVIDRIMYYFIYTYFCGAAYDEYIYGMGAVSVYSASMILIICSVTEAMKSSSNNIFQLKNAKPSDSAFLKNVLSLEEIATIIYNYSRELEHSTDNMIAMEQLLEENRL